MKPLSIFVALLTLTCFAGIASAAKGTKPVVATITKIDGATITLQPKVAKGAPEATPLVVTTTDATTVTINDEKKALTDLTVGERVKVTLDTDGKTATAITVSQKKKNAAPAAETPSTAPATQPAK